MQFPVRPELSTASVVHGLCIDHDRRHGQLCTVLNPPHRTYLSGYVCSDQPSHFSFSTGWNEGKLFISSDTNSISALKIKSRSSDLPIA